MRLRVWLASASAVILLSILSSGVQAKTVYVDSSIAAAGDGHTWATAKATVTAGLAACASGDQVWVAKGTYLGCIVLVNGAALYGGFPSGGGAWSSRNSKTNVTVLDGNQGGSVVTSPSGANATTVIDGFTIRNGKSSTDGGGIFCYSSSPTISNNTITANSVNVTRGVGGGIWCNGSSPMISGNTIVQNSSISGAGIYCTVSSPTITNNIITGNSAAGGPGGGISCSSCSLTISNNTIAANSTSTIGGGIYCYSCNTLDIHNNTITANSAITDGGGICCSSSSGTISNNTITANSATNSGGGIYCLACSSGVTISYNTIVANSAVTNGGGADCESSVQTFFTNVITGNSATIGGGIYCNTTADCYWCVANNTITGNSASAGGGIYTSASYGPMLFNNIVSFNTSGIFNLGSSPVLMDNCVYNPGGANYSGVPAGTGDIQVDPMLVSVEYGQVRIQPDSPCIDAGWIWQQGVDMDGQPRQGPHVDIGAYESEGTTWTFTPVVVRVSPAGNDSNDGSSWALAKRTVQAGINAASLAGGEVWVAAGAYNGNTVLTAYAYLYGGFAGTEISRGQRNWNANATILDGGGSGSVVTAQTGCNLTVSGIDGFTIRNGKAASGGGIYCPSSSPTICNNTITGNGASANGGGIFCGYSSALISDNIIAANSAIGGGGGICCCSSSPTISNNTIAANSGSDGGGIYGDSSSATISNNIVAFNSSGLYEINGRNNCVYNPSGYNYSGLPAGTGDISADPVFVDMAAGDYDITAGSPCIDAGWNGAPGIGTADIHGDPRIIDSIIDIGADESPFTTNGIQILKNASSGTLAYIHAGIVSAVFDDCFYVECANRISGIRVVQAGVVVTVGMQVDVAGAAATDADGELYLNASSVKSIGSGAVTPLLLNGRSVGGGSFGGQEGTWSNQWTLTSGGTWGLQCLPNSGLNNIGLLVSISGKYTPVDEQTFTIDDGSGEPVKCTVPDGSTLGSGWTYLSVTGISSCEMIMGELHPLIRVRTPGDIIAY